MAATILTIVTAAISYEKILQAIGDAWPPEPEVTPQEVYRGDELLLPFKLTNPSKHFSIENVALTCGVELAYFEDADGKRFGVGEMALRNSTATIPPGATIDYECNASFLASVDKVGRLSLRDELKTQAGGFRAPIKILKMCIWVGGDFNTGPIPRSFTSKIFKWPATQRAHQWSAGHLSRDANRRLSNNVDPDNLDCQTSPSGPYAYFVGQGLPAFVFDILSRPRF